MSGSPATCPLPPRCQLCRWRSWPSICSRPSVSGPSRLCRRSMEGRLTRIALAVWAVLILLFLFVPLLLIFLYAFNKSNIESWPIPGFTLKWFTSTWNDAEVRTSLRLSIQAGLTATAMALVLGSCGTVARHHTKVCVNNGDSFLFVHPLELLQIITLIAQNHF